MDVPAADAKKCCDTFLRRFRRCPENPRMPLDEWRLLLWIEALGEDYDDVAGTLKYMHRKVKFKIKVCPFLSIKLNYLFADEIYVKWRKLRYRHLQLSDAKLNMIKSLHKQYQLALITNGPSTSQWEKVLLKLLN